MKKSFLLAIIILGSAAFSCKKKTVEAEVNFNKTELLVNVGNEIIIPRFNDLKTGLIDLKTVWDIFESSPTEQNLITVQDNWLNANIKFQRAKIFNFGPALDLGLKSSFGTYPTDTIKIINNTVLASPSLGSIDNIDAIGFPALEFLFFRNDALNYLNNEPQYGQYANSILTKMLNEIDLVLNAWTSSYSANFKNGSGTEVTSGFSLLVNAFNQDFELAKNAKLGIPIGSQSLGIPQLEYEEAPYANQSLRLLTESLIGLRQLYDGTTESGTNGLGFDDYLVTLEKNQTHDGISDRFNYAFTQLANMDADLDAEVQGNLSGLNDLHTNLQAMVVFLKTDMTSAFGVLVTYQDNDGD